VFFFGAYLGKILNPDFAQYRVPRFRDLPQIENVLVDRKEREEPKNCAAAGMNQHAGIVNSSRPTI
jgi:CO/xanthine dehydrogenase Mo-binding subunit